MLGKRALRDTPCSTCAHFYSHVAFTINSAAMMFEDQKSGKLARIKKLLEQRSWAKTTIGAEGSERKKDVAPAPGDSASRAIQNQKPDAVEKETSANPTKEQVNRAQNSQAEEPPIPGETPKEPPNAPSSSPATQHDDEHPDNNAGQNQGDTVVEKAVVEETLQGAVDPSISPIPDDADATEKKAIEENAPSAAGLTAPTPLSPAPVDDMHEEASRTDGGVPHPTAVWQPDIAQKPTAIDVGASISDHSSLSSVPAHTLTGQIDPATARTKPAPLTADYPSHANFDTPSVPVAQTAVTQSISGHGTEETRVAGTSSLTKRHVDDAPSAAPKKQKVDEPTSVSFGENSQPVEMRNPVTGAVVKTFKNAADAASANHLNARTLVDICARDRKSVV